jgi:hypothetical protein
MTPDVPTDDALLQAWEEVCDVFDEVYPVEDPRFEAMFSRAYRAIREVLVSEQASATVPVLAEALQAVISKLESWYETRLILIAELEMLETRSRSGARIYGRSILKRSGVILCEDNWLTDPRACNYYERLCELRYPRKADPPTTTTLEPSSS